MSDDDRPFDVIGAHEAVHGQTISRERYAALVAAEAERDALRAERVTVAGPRSDVDRLAEIRARERAATDGPWSWEFGWPTSGGSLEHGDRIAALQLIQTNGERWVVTDGSVIVTPVPPFYELDEQEPYWDESHIIAERPDAEFIAHAREDVPNLLALVDTLRAELAAIVERVGGLNDGESLVGAVGMIVDEWDHNSKEMSKAGYETIPKLTAELDEARRKLALLTEALERCNALAMGARSTEMPPIIAISVVCREALHASGHQPVARRAGDAGK